MAIIARPVFPENSNCSHLSLHQVRPVCAIGAIGAAMLILKKVTRRFPSRDKLRKMRSRSRRDVTANQIQISVFSTQHYAHFE
jgi:hypothetical protein